MADEKRGLSPGSLAHMREAFFFRAHVKSVGRWRVTHKGAGRRGLLPLAAAVLGAFLKSVPQHGIVPFAQMLNEVTGTAFARRRDPVFARLNLRHASNADVLPGGQMIMYKILDDNVRIYGQCGPIICLKIASIEQNLSLVRIIQADEKLHQRGFAS